MDVLLTHGYFLTEDEKEMRVMKPYPPLGILYLSAFLKERGVAASVYDTTFRSFDEFLRFIAQNRPPVVGIASNLMTKRNVIRQMKACASHGCRVIVGGPDVPEYAEEYVRAGADAAVIGEGEETSLELLEALRKGGNLERVSGIAFRNGDGAIVRTPARTLIADLDALPLPDRDAIAMEEYLSAWRLRHGAGSVSLICARGCPYTCTWCSRSVYGDTHRRRSVSKVVDEIAMIREKYRPDMLWFADDVFTMSHSWFREFYREMKKRGIRVPFECITRADRLNEEIIRCMSELGAFRIWYGSESGSQRILDAMERKVTVGQIRETTKLVRKFGIQAGMFVMLGYPGEEIGDIDETAEHLKAANPDAFLTTVAYPIKGTKFYGEVRDSLRTPGDWSSYSDREIRYRRTYSDGFYWFAHRYLVNEVEHHRLRQNGHGTFSARAATLAKARLARAAMALTKGLR